MSGGRIIVQFWQVTLTSKSAIEKNLIKILLNNLNSLEIEGQN